MSKIPAAVQRPSRTLFAHGVALLWTFKVFNIAIALYTTAVAVRHFGLHDYGIWLLISQVAVSVQLLEFGISSSISRVLPAHLARSEIEQASAFVSTCLFVLVAMGTAIVLLSYPFATTFVDVFFEEGESARIALVIALVTFIATGLGLPARLGYGLLASLHRFDICFGIELLFILVRGIAIYMYFTFGSPTLLGLVLITLVPQLLSYCVQTFYSTRWTPIRHLKLSLRPSGSLRTLVSFSAASMLTTAAHTVLLQGGPIVVGLQTTTERVAILTLPLFVIVHAFSFIQMGGAFMSPVASQLDAMGDKRGLAETLRRAGRYAFFVSLLMLGVLGVAGNEALRLWLGSGSVSSENLTLMHTLLVVIATGAALGVPGVISRGALVSLGYHWAVGRTDLMGSILGLAAGTALSLVTREPLLGMAVGISFGLLIKGYLTVLGLTASYMELRSLALLRAWLTRPLCVAVTAAAAAYASTAMLGDAAALLRASVAVSVYGCLWLAGGWWFVAAPDDRQRLIGHLRRMVR